MILPITSIRGLTTLVPPQREVRRTTGNAEKQGWQNRTSSCGVSAQEDHSSAPDERFFSKTEAAGRKELQKR